MMLRGAAVARLMLSAFSFAKLFGRISPNVSTRTVVTAVAMAGPLVPNSAVATVVAMAVEAMFTTLLPIRMADSVRSKSSARRSTAEALRSPSSAFVFSRTRLTEESAVSLAEKNAEKARGTKNER